MAWALVRIHIGGVPFAQEPEDHPDRPAATAQAGHDRMLARCDRRAVDVDHLEAVRARAAAIRSSMRRPINRTRGASNITSNASLTRTTVPSASTIITPSASDSMRAVWRRSTSRTLLLEAACAR